MSQAKIVKRYANRKLYDTERSCYVTLDDISLMISAGDEVRVIDNKSGEDLTSVTLAQIIFEAEKKTKFMPLSLLRDLIQNKGGELGERYRGQVEKAQKGVKDIRERVKKTISTSGEQVRAPVDRVFESTQKAFDDLQRSVEERIKGGVGTLGRELDNLRERLAELEASLAAQKADQADGDNSSDT